MANNYYTKFIDFFQKHNLYDEQVFCYLRQNSILFDYRDEEQRNSIGYHFYLDRDKNLANINLIVPFIDSEETLLINIHEYTHGLMLYKYLGKKYKHTKESEILPMLLERLYIEENPSEKITKFEEKLNNQISNESPEEYKIALKIQKELLEYYSKEQNIKKLSRKIKKLSRKTSL